MPDLRLHDISFAANSNTIFEGVNFELLAGQSIAISGQSGRGKTTLLRIILGLAQPVRGKIWLDDVEITSLNVKLRTKLRRDVLASSPQTPHIIPSLSAAQNVAIALQLRVPKAENARLLVLEALDKFRVLHLKDRYVDHLSGGEQRRIALARAFVGAPSIIFLDEPTEALDQKLAREISASIFSLAADQNSSLVIATHDSELIARCDHHLDMDWTRLLK